GTTVTAFTTPACRAQPPIGKRSLTGAPRSGRARSLRDAGRCGQDRGRAATPPAALAPRSQAGSWVTVSAAAPGAGRPGARGRGLLLVGRRRAAGSRPARP